MRPRLAADDELGVVRRRERQSHEGRWCFMLALLPSPAPRRETKVGQKGEIEPVRSETLRPRNSPIVGEPV